VLYRVLHQFSRDAAAQSKLQHDFYSNILLIGHNDASTKKSRDSNRWVVLKSFIWWAGLGVANRALGGSARYLSDRRLLGQGSHGSS
jgi:hypothetical protein